MTNQSDISLLGFQSSLRGIRDISPSHDARTDQGYEGEDFPNTMNMTAAGGVIPQIQKGHLSL